MDYDPTKVTFEARLLKEVPGICHVNKTDDGYIIGAALSLHTPNNQYLIVHNDELTGLDEDQCFDYILKKWNERGEK